MIPDGFRCLIMDSIEELPGELPAADGSILCLCPGPGAGEFRGRED